MFYNPLLVYNANNICCLSIPFEWKLFDLTMTYCNGIIFGISKLNMSSPKIALTRKH